MLLLSSAVPNFVGWLLIVLSRYTIGAFKPVILTGRFLIGFAMGWLTVGVPVSVWFCWYYTIDTVGMYVTYVVDQAEIAHVGPGNEARFRYQEL